jgi:ribosome-binding protein aMBF1 (putative translation factor)
LGTCENPPEVTGLRSRRQALQLSVRDLAAYLDLSPPVVYSWEVGQALIPDVHLQRLANLFGIEPDRLRGEDEATHQAFKQAAISRVTAVAARR